MKKYLKMLRKGDLVIILFLMMASFFPLGIFTYHQAKAESAERIAVISVDGEAVQEFVLADDGETETYVYADDHGHENTIVREGTVIYMESSDCKDQLCVRMGAKSKAGETILCLPNRVLVEVKAAQDTMTDEDAIDILS